MMNKIIDVIYKLHYCVFESKTLYFAHRCSLFLPLSVRNKYRSIKILFVNSTAFAFGDGCPRIEHSLFEWFFIIDFRAY